MEKDLKKNIYYIYIYIHIYVMESLCYTLETNRILQINYTSI